MKAGTLNRQVVIQSRDSGTDDAGQPVQTWTTFATVWADIRTQGGLATLRSGVATDVTGYSIRIRYRTDITAGMRVVCDSVVYDVKHVLLDVAGRDWTDLVCERGGNDG